MAINAYTGLMGSGKTYEVVSVVILPAIKSGRNVVTNVRGLNYELICKHLKEPDKGVAEFGKIRVVKNAEVESNDFFPKFQDEKFVVGPDTVVQPGDLVAIDEAWRPWGSTSKCINSHMSFFREHRQCVNDKGGSCDLVIMSQDITDIHKLLKNVIETSFLFTKLKTLGFSKRYRIEVFEGSKLFKSKRVSWTTQTYNKAIFPLYKSYASDSGAGVEKVVDSRQNILKSGAFLMPLVVAAVLIVAGGWKLMDFFNPSRYAKQSEPDGKQSTTVRAVDGKPSPTVPASVPVVPLVPGAAESIGGGVSIAGYVTIGGDTWAVLSSGDGLRIASPSVVRSRGVSAMTVDADKAIPAYLVR